MADLSPTFTRSLKETYNSKINEINITCHVRAFPKSTISWAKDGVTIEPSEKYQLIEHDDGLCEVNISDATKQDVSSLAIRKLLLKENKTNRDHFHLKSRNIFNKSNHFCLRLQNGKYSCIAENRAGKAEISHIVLIQIREHRSSVASLSSIKESPPTPQPEEDDDNKSVASKASKAPSGKGRPAKKEDPPSGGGRRYAPQPPPDPKQQLFFIAFLTDRTIPVGGKTKISCYVEGPDPQARWFKGSTKLSPKEKFKKLEALSIHRKLILIFPLLSFADDNPLQMSPRVRVDLRDGLITLNIQSAVVEDSGVYRILVRNPSSEITSSCTLNVYQTNQPTATAPLFTNSIKGMSFRVVMNGIFLTFHVFIIFEVSSDCTIRNVSNFYNA